MSTDRTIYFNGKSFDELGLIITQTVVPPVSHKKYRTVSIPDGPVLFEDTGQKDPITFSINCTLTEPGKLREIYKMVSEPGTIILPDEPDKYYYGILTIATPQNIILHWNKITFTMTADPYAYSVINPEIVTTLAVESDYKKANINNYGTAEAEPVYKITAESKGVVDFWIDAGFKSININMEAGEQIIIDVGKRTVKDSAGNNAAHKIQGDYSRMTIPSGMYHNLNVRNVSELIVTLNERWF